ncbi:MAG TPA: prepilin-type N-terminal cleavage/methylation domain-containing protein [Candidatus Omnitrophota bacterium]|nr:prepilin-type N-terminal cleavage/methylation domain-containing protein [Candidatus Omnitrophota bacterium]
MMILPTGNPLCRNRYNRSLGFSLIEVMLCVVILSAGLVAVNQAMLSSLSVIRYALTRGEAARIVNLKIWDIVSAAQHRRQAPPAFERGTLLGSAKTLNYELKSAAEGSRQLYRVRLDVQWDESNKNRGITRDFYVRLPEIPKK